MIQVKSYCHNKLVHTENIPINLWTLVCRSELGCEEFWPEWKGELIGHVIYEYCVLVCEPFVQFYLNSCLQKSCWLPHHQPCQILKRATSAMAARSWSACVMAWAPSPPRCLLATSLPCCCCFWRPLRLHNKFIQEHKGTST